MQGSKSTRKGMDASHLVNFRYTNPATQTKSSSIARTPPPRKDNRHHQTTNRIKSNASFLASKFRIAVYQECDVSNNPDKFVNWDEICFISAINDGKDVFECAICLDNINLPMITKCGHEYWYFDAEKHKNCPICGDNIYRSDLKHLFLLNQMSIEPIVGHRYHFDLLGKNKNRNYPQNVACPNTMTNTSNIDSKSNFVSIKEDVLYANSLEQDNASISIPNMESAHAKYGRLCWVNEPQMMCMFDRRVAEALNDNSSSGSQYIPLVIESVDEQRGRWINCIRRYHKNNNNNSNSNNCKKVIESAPISTSLESSTLSAGVFASSSLSSSSSLLPSPSVKEVSSTRSLHKDSSSTPPIPPIPPVPCWDHFMYQASDGALAYMHPFSLKCLLVEARILAQQRQQSEIVTSEGQAILQEDSVSSDHNNASSRSSSIAVDDMYYLPKHVTADIVSVEYMMVTKEIRQQYTFVRHLPLNTSFSLVEVTFHRKNDRNGKMSKRGKTKMNSDRDGSGVCNNEIEHCHRNSNIDNNSNMNPDPSISSDNIGGAASSECYQLSPEAYKVVKNEIIQRQKRREKKEIEKDLKKHQEEVYSSMVQENVKLSRVIMYDEDRKKREDAVNSLLTGPSLALAISVSDIVAVGENIQKITMNGDEDANDTGASSTTIQEESTESSSATITTSSSLPASQCVDESRQASFATVTQMGGHFPSLRSSNLASHSDISITAGHSTQKPSISTKWNRTRDVVSGEGTPSQSSSSSLQFNHNNNNNNSSNNYNNNSSSNNSILNSHTSSDMDIPLSSHTSASTSTSSLTVSSTPKGVSTGGTKKKKGTSLLSNSR